jgi:flagellar motility protein MotE (MotC chaperone)
MSRLRLIPVVIFALVSLLTIRMMSIAFDNRPVPQIADLGPSAGDRFARTIERARLGSPDDQIITGSTPGAPPAAAPTQPAPPAAAGAQPSPATNRPNPPVAESEGTRLPPPAARMPERGAQSSPAERELLEKLRERRSEIDARDRDIEMRDNLLRTTERKLDEKIGQLRTLESQLEANQAAKNDPKARFKPLVVMYESMKPKEAARVFDRLDLRVLIDLVGHMNPRKVSEIMAAMEPAAAERLTVALARQAQGGPVQEANAPQQQDGELARLPTPRR